MLGGWHELERTDCDEDQCIIMGNTTTRRIEVCGRDDQLRKESSSECSVMTNLEF